MKKYYVFLRTKRSSKSRSSALEFSMLRSVLLSGAVSAVGLAAFVPPAAIAQSTSSALGGQVLDQAGAPVAGASVVITHVPSGTTRTTLSDAGGRFLAPGLRVGGPFAVTAAKDNQTARQENLELKLAETLEVDLVLRPDSQSVTVLGLRGFSDPRANRFGAGTNFSPSDLATLPGFSRDLQEIARLDPRLSQIDRSTDKISALGQNFRYNTITIDGVGVTDPFGLNPNNLPTLRQPIPFDAIESVQVNITNFDVSQAGYSGANINAVTKSGTNEFKGSLYTSRQDQRLAGDRVTNLSTNETQPQAAFKVSTNGFTLGGPIMKDTLFFFVNAERFSDSRAGLPQFGPVGSPLTNIGITEAQIARAQAIARNRYNFDAGNLVPSLGSLKSESALVKIDWNINPDHRLSFAYNSSESSEPIYYGFGTSSLGLSSHWSAESKKFRTSTLQLYSEWTDDLNTEIKLSRRDYDKIFDNNSAAPAVGIAFSGTAPAGSGLTSSATRFLNFGTEQFRHLNILRTDTTEVFAAAIYKLREHELKLGLSRESNDIYNAFLPQTNGVYTFRCDNRMTYSTFSGAVDCNSGEIAGLAALENFDRGRPTDFTLRLPQSGLTLADGAARFSFSNTGVFLQDTYRVSRNFTLLAGVRVDRQVTDDRPLKNSAGAQPLIAGNPATNTRQSGGFARDNSDINGEATLVQPRLGFNWRLDDGRETRIRGGYGLFKGGAPTVWFSNPFSNTGVQTLLASCSGTGSTACPVGGLAVSLDPSKQSTIPGAPPRPAIDYNDPGLELPSIWKGNLAVETRIPGGLVASAELIRTDTNADIFFEHLNLGPPTRTGSDGRQLYYNAAGYNPASFTIAANGNVSTVGTAGVAAKALSNSAFDNTILTKKTGKGYGNVATISLASPVDASGLGWNLAYTFSDVKSVQDLSSSIAYSNWRFFPRFQGNEEAIARSRYEIKNRVNFGATYRKRFFEGLTTSVGVFAEHRSGYPYSWTFFNDANGDGQAGNDLLFVPKAPGSGEVVFAQVGSTTPAEAERRFWDVVNSDKGLRSHAGQVVPRNSSRAPRVNVIDLRVAQDLPAPVSRHLAALNLDIFNFGNLLNRRWGRTIQSVFEAREYISYAGLSPEGKYIYVVGSPEDLQLQQQKNISQWGASITLRYSF
jgi:hypothetical protein